MKKVALSLIVLFSALAVSFSQNVLPDWAIGNFVRPAKVNPVISPNASSKFVCPWKGEVDWESNDTFNPAAVAKKDGKIVVLYRAEDKAGVNIGQRTSRIGYAESSDGLHFKRRPEPVFYPAKDNQDSLEWPGGCEDPRVAVTEDNTYVMLYTQWNRKNARLAVATSKDLIHWTKYGPAFRKAFNGKFYNMWTKSASIVTKVVGNRLVISKINGKYWMYWGESNVHAATSDDLVNWEPLVDANGELVKLMSPRKGYFDSQLTECGPPAVITDKGIVLMYNGKNGTKNGDQNYHANSYCAGQALFDASHPEKLITRLDKPFFYPQEDFEKSGQYAAGTVFIEGLVFSRGKWFLYYGCADSRVAVAVCDGKKNAHK